MASAQQPVESYPVHHVPMSRPFVWLREGWDDLLHHRSASLAYGWLVSALGALILAYSRHPYFLIMFCIGFLLVGPILGAGLCELSRCQDAGQQANFQSSLRPLSHNRKGLLALGVRLIMIAIMWFVIAAVILTAAMGSIAPSIESTVGGDVLTRLSATQVLAYVAVGVSLSVIVFALSVVAVPMIVERHVDASTAMRVSLRVSVRELPAMLVWAALIALLVVVGFATWMIGLVVIYPLLGHATWRAYRELVDQ